MMVRYHLRCKNSLLLLKHKFLLRVGDKKFVFLIEFTFIFFYFYLFTLLYQYFFTKWCYSLEVDFFYFWFRIESWQLQSYVLSLVHGSFPIWTLLCGVYCPYGLIFFANFDRSITAICLATPILQCTSELRTGHQRLCHV